MSHWSPPPKSTHYAGPTTCLRCDRVFESWDRRQNRLCQDCREAMARDPTEEPVCRFFKPRRPSGDA